MSLVIQTLLIFCVISYGMVLIYFQRKQSTESVKAANLAAEVAIEAAKTSQELQRGLKEVHILVNNNLTIAKQGELDQAKGRLELLNRLRKPQESDLDEIQSVSQRINSLELELSYRK